MTPAEVSNATKQAMDDGRWRTCRDVANRIGCPAGRVSSVLKAMVRKGHAVSETADSIAVYRKTFGREQ